MALNPVTLANLIKANMLANPATLAQDNAALAAMCTAIAAAVVTHIQSSAVVAVVTTCGVGPGTGTGTVT